MQYKMQPDKLWRLDVGNLRADTLTGADESLGLQFVMHILPACDAYLKQTHSHLPHCRCHYFDAQICHSIFNKNIIFWKKILYFPVNFPGKWGTKALYL